MSDLDPIDWDGPAAYRVSFATRHGGISEGPYASLNLGLLTKDDSRRVRENRRRLCAHVGADPDRATMSHQVHGVRVSRARPTGLLNEAPRPELRDGAWTDEAGQAMLVLSADCLPIAVCRTAGAPALAAVHAGWRGLLSGIIDNACRSRGRRIVRRRRRPWDRPVLLRGGRAGRGGVRRHVRT